MSMFFSAPAVVFKYTGVLASIPATCAVGDLAFITNATAGQNIYECASLNVWTQQTGGAGTTINATNNTLPKRSSATVFVDSSISDNGTTVTITEPVSISSGATSGVYDLVQGTTNAGASPCTTANSICDQAPTAVTSYVITRPGAAASGIVLNSNSANVVTQSNSGDASHAVHVTGQTATKSIYTLCPAAAGGCNVAGLYRVIWYFNQGGTACGTPGTGGVTFAVSWTDNAGAHSAVALPMDDASSLTATGTKFTAQTSNTAAWASGVFNIWSTGAQPIQVTNTYTACSVGTLTWELAASVEQVQ